MKNRRIELIIVSTLSLLIFLSIQFYGLKILSELQGLFIYYFSLMFPISYNFTDILLITFIPFWGLIYNKGRKTNSLQLLIKDIFTIVGCTLVFVILSLYLLTFIETQNSPWIPSYIMELPFSIYYTLFLILGIFTPILLTRVIFKK